ncbi:hypothetical protein GW17_00022965 [Ensete ventricosum]|nr:hypothetical protein GW17_00022965 [Ensete ventricosum]
MQTLPDGCSKGRINEMAVNPVRANCIVDRRQVLSAAAFPSPLQSPATTETAFFASRLASAYSKLRHIQLARELFDGILHPWVCGPNEVRMLFSSGDFRLELVCKVRARLERLGDCLT